MTRSYSTEDATAEVRPATWRPSASMPVPGGRVGRYRIVEALASGGMGTVFVGYDPELRRNVAIKCVRFGQSDPAAARRARLRLQVEAQAMAKLCHPNVLPVYDVGTLPSGDVFIAAELVEGQTLQRWLQATTRSPAAILDCFVQAGRGLAAAHEAGVVHRDFKPDNVLVGTDGRVRVLDFGLAVGTGSRSLRSETLESKETPPVSGHVSSEEHLTAVGMVVGTPAYMAPEQHAGRTVDARTDQFGFCVAVWRALFGTHPFTREIGRSWTHAILHGPAPRVPRHRNVDERIARALLRGLSREPADRWPSMTALLEALQAGPRRRWPVLGLGLASAGALAGVAIGTRPVGCQHVLERAGSIWNDDARRAVASAFERTELPYAGTAARDVTAAVDRRIDEWLVARTAACHAGVERTGATVCLDTRLQELGALVRVLRAADAPTVEHASALIDRIAPVAGCSNEGPSVSPEDRPEDDHEIRALHGELTTLALAEQTGRWRETLLRARSVLARAERTGDRALVATAELRLGNLLARTGDYDESLRHLERAVFEAETHREDRLAAEASLALVDLLGTRLARYDDARRWLHAARAAVARLDDDPSLRSRVIQIGARLHYALGEYEDARVEFERALAIERERAPRSRAVGSLTNVLGVLAMWRGEFERAHASFEEAHAILATTLGPGHPETSHVVGNKAILLEQTGDFDGALLEYRRENALKIAALGPTHESVGRSFYNLGGVLATLKRFDEALQAQRKAYEILAPSLGPDHPVVGLSMVQLGALLQIEGRSEAALAMLTRGLVVVEANLGPDHRDTANARHAFARTLAQLGRDDEAIEMLEPTLVVLERGDNEPTELPRARLLLASLLARRGDHRQALDQARRAARELEPHATALSAEREELEALLRRLHRDAPP